MRPTLQSARSINKNNASPGFKLRTSSLHNNNNPRHNHSATTEQILWESISGDRQRLPGSCAGWKRKLAKLWLKTWQIAFTIDYQPYNLDNKNQKCLKCTYTHSELPHIKDFFININFVPISSKLSFAHPKEKAATLWLKTYISQSLLITCHDAKTINPKKSQTHLYVLWAYSIMNFYLI